MVRDSTSWIITGAKTFRLGSRKILRTFGGNLQNIEKLMRMVYVPDKGKGFVQTDQSGAEALFVAYLCEAGQYRELFKNRISPHSYLAANLFRDIWPLKMRESGVSDPTFDIDKVLSCSIKDLNENVWWKPLNVLIKDSDNWSIRYYYLAKQTEHSSNYGIQAPMFRMNVLEKSKGTINISKEDSVKFLSVKHSLYPEIQDWHRRLRRQIEQTRMMFNFFGEPYTLTCGDILETYWKEYIAWIPQSTVGEITNRAFASLQNFIEKEKLNWDALINGHDSILSQAPIAELKDLAKVQSGFIEQEFESPVDGTRFKMKSETQIGLNWAPYKKDVNPLGLKELKLQ